MEGYISAANVYPINQQQENLDNGIILYNYYDIARK